MDGQRNAAPGASAYFASVLARIRDAHSDLPLDPVIVQSLLLCLVAGRSDGKGIENAGRKHLVLRTKDEDVGIVLQLTYLVSMFIATYHAAFFDHTCKQSFVATSQKQVLTCTL
jgi:hypothetical protein